MLADGVTRLLGIVERDTDPLCGLWAVEKWDYSSTAHEKFYVSGHLAVLYAYPDERRWRGTLLLHYQKEYSGKWLRPDGWMARIRGYCIDCAYDVVLLEDSPGVFSGTTDQTHRNPPLRHTNTGRFEQLTFNRPGQLVGRFVNSNIYGEAKVLFHNRRRWRELEAAQ
jgi:hypothetical protein